MTKGRKTTRDEHIEIVSHCIANSKNYCETIERYGVPYQQIYSWVRKYEACGVDTLLDRRGMRKDKASMSEVEKLHAQLKLAEAENLRLQMENELLKIGGARKVDRRGLSLVRLENKYLAMESLHEKKKYPITTLCDTLELNRSSYYKWLSRDADTQEAIVVFAGSTLM